MSECHCYRTLVLKPLAIDFHATEAPAYAEFCLGSSWAYHNLTKVVYHVNDEDPVCLTGLQTDCKGHFKFEIPLETEKIAITVYISEISVCLKSKTDCHQTHPDCHQTKPDCHKYQTDSKKPKQKGYKVKGYFYPYETYQLVCRSYPGDGNCLGHPEWGSAGQGLDRHSHADYGPDDRSVTLGDTDRSVTLGDTDRNVISTSYRGCPRNVVSKPRVLSRAVSREVAPQGLAVRGPLNPNPRVISNAICKQTTSVVNNRGLSDMLWAWGQFVDHEIDLSPDNSGESANMITSAEDPNEEYPGRTIPFARSGYTVDESGTRQQSTIISAFIDGTNTYGFNTTRAYALRRLDGTGKLKTTDGPDGPLLMNNSIDLPNANPTGLAPEDQFLSGDIRANETLTLIALHSLFAREHNRMCDQVLGEFPSWAGQDELIYQEARRRVFGIMQAITYEEFLPALLGSQNLDDYSGYQSTVNPTIANEFSTAGYRLGHSMLSDNLRTVTAGGSVGSVPLRDSFFNPDWIRTNGINNLLVGATQQSMQEVDHQIVDGVRNFLFIAPTIEHLLDLASLNIQRGRDHGLPGYNAVREAYGLSANSTWAQVTSNLTLQTKLAELYGSNAENGPDYLDPWLGCLLEDHLMNSSVGELVNAILRDQFERLRAGDRFYYENDSAISPALKQTIRNTRLSDVIRRNTGRTEVTNDVFRV